jgi:hypothetical protein
MNRFEHSLFIRAIRPTLRTFQPVFFHRYPLLMHFRSPLREQEYASIAMESLPSCKGSVNCGRLPNLIRQRIWAELEVQHLAGRPLPRFHMEQGPSGVGRPQALALNGKFVVLRVPYPIGFFAKGMDASTIPTPAGTRAIRASSIPCRDRRVAGRPLVHGQPFGSLRSDIDRYRCPEENQGPDGRPRTHASCVSEGPPARMRWVNTSPLTASNLPQPDCTARVTLIRASYEWRANCSQPVGERRTAFEHDLGALLPWICFSSANVLPYPRVV